MPNEIRFRVRPVWAKNEESLVKRIARVVSSSGDDMVALQTTSGGYKWCLHTGGNDWKTNGVETVRNEQTGKDEYYVTVFFRYGGGGNAPAMEALRVFLEWSLYGTD